MLIKHNLFTKTTTQFVSGVWNSSGQYRISKKDNIITFSVSSDKTTSLEAAGISVENEKNKNFLIEVENLCGQEILIGTGNTYKRMVINPYEKRQFNFNAEKAYYFSVDPIKINLTATYKLRINPVMASDEPVDIYLPHKDNLPEDKQPLLPPEGHYKEIQAL